MQKDITQDNHEGATLDTPLKDFVTSRDTIIQRNAMSILKQINKVRIEQIKEEAKRNNP